MRLPRGVKCVYEIFITKSHSLPTVYMGFDIPRYLDALKQLVQPVLAMGSHAFDPATGTDQADTQRPAQQKTAPTRQSGSSPVTDEDSENARDDVRSGCSVQSQIERVSQHVTQRHGSPSIDDEPVKKRVSGLEPPTFTLATRSPGNPNDKDNHEVNNSDQFPRSAQRSKSVGVVQPDIDLQLLIEVWPTLPQILRSAIAAMVRSI